MDRRSFFRFLGVATQGITRTVWQDHGHTHNIKVGEVRTVATIRGAGHVNQVWAGERWVMLDSQDGAATVAALIRGRL